MKIAVANSRKDTVWKNIDITWDKFLVMVSSTKVTTETIINAKIIMYRVANMSMYNRR